MVCRDIRWARHTRGHRGCQPQMMVRHARALTCLQRPVLRSQPPYRPLAADGTRRPLQPKSTRHCHRSCPRQKNHRHRRHCHLLNPLLLVRPRWRLSHRPWTTSCLCTGFAAAMLTAASNSSQNSGTLMLDALRQLCVDGSAGCPMCRRLRGCARPPRRCLLNSAVGFVSSLVPSRVREPSESRAQAPRCRLLGH